MTENEAEDWLSVALGEVAYFQTDILAAGCAQARRTCTHHAQIIPAIIAVSAPMQRRRSELNALPTVTWGDAPQLPAPKLKQSDVDSMTPDIIKIGLGCGALEQDESGNVRPAA